MDLCNRTRSAKFVLRYWRLWLVLVMIGVLCIANSKRSDIGAMMDPPPANTSIVGVAHQETIPTTYDEIFDLVAESVEKSLGPWGFWMLVAPGDKVVIKVNLMQIGHSPSDGQVTDVRVVRAVVEMILPIIGESGELMLAGGTGTDWDPDHGIHVPLAFHEQGYDNNSDGYFDYATSVELIDLNAPNNLANAKNSAYVTEKYLQNGLARTTWYLPNDMADCDVMMNMPVLKTHRDMGMTIALKNRLGCWPTDIYYGQPGYHDGYGWLKCNIHEVGTFEENVVDWQRVRKDDFVVVSALTAMANGPNDPMPVFLETNAILSGRDPVAVDTCGVAMLGLRSDRPYYLPYAASEGIGYNSAAHITNGDGITIGELREYYMDTFGPVSRYPFPAYYGYSPNWTEPCSDWTSPTVTITSPSDQSTVSGTVSVVATISGAVRVELHVNEELCALDAESPWSLQWDSSEAWTGWYTLEVVAVDGEFNEGRDSVDVYVNNGPTPTMTPTPIPLSWDEDGMWDLDWQDYGYGDPLDPPIVYYEEAQVNPGQGYWRLYYGEYWNWDESAGKHYVYYTVLNQNGTPAQGETVNLNTTQTTTDQNGEADIAMYGTSWDPTDGSGPYNAWIDGDPSDKVYGMGLPANHHVCFILKWIWSYKEYSPQIPTIAPTPTPVPTPGNHSFESGGNPPSQWTEWGSSSKCETIYGGYIGDYACGVKDISTSGQGVYQLISGFNPGNQYRISAYFKSTWGTPGQINGRLGIDEDGGSSVSGVDVWGTQKNGSTTWQEITVTFTATASTATLFIKASADYANYPYWAYFDWVQTEGLGGGYTPTPTNTTGIAPTDTATPTNTPAPPSTPVVEQSSFETAITPWAMWKGTGGNSDGLERDYLESGAHDGSYALAVKGIGTGGKGAFQYISSGWMSGHTYRLSAWVKNLANNGIDYSIGYKLGNTGSSGGPSATYGTSVEGSYVWTQVTRDFTYSGSSGATIYLRAVYDGASERAGFDLVTVQDLTGGGPTNTPTITPTSGGPTNTPVGTPVVQQQSFESGITPWAIWIGTGGNGDGLERDWLGSNAYDGVWALGVKGFGSGGKGAFQYISSGWASGHTYRLGVYCKNISNTNINYSIGYKLGNTGSSGGESATYGSTVSHPSSWTQATCDFEYSGSNGVTIYLRAVNDGHSERAGFDYITVQALD